MLELALNKSKEKASGIGVGNIVTTTTALNQPNQLHHPNHSQQQQVPSNLEDYLTGKMINDKNGRLWIFSNNRINFIQRELFSDNLKFESFFFQNNSRKNALGWEHVNKYDDSKYIFGSGTGYLLVDLDKIKSVKPIIAIHKILVKDNIQNFSQVSSKNDLLNRYC